MRPKLLVIPHIYAEDIRVREIELAKRLTNEFEVYCLKWADALHVHGSSGIRRRAGQLWNGLHVLLSPQRIRQGPEGIHYVQASVLQPVVLRRLVGDPRSLALSRAFNTRILARLIDRLGIDYLLIASAKFFVPKEKRNGLRAFFDIVDWYAEERATPWQRQVTRDYLAHLASTATGIFTISEALSEKLQRDYGLRSFPVPNGADLDGLRNVPVGDLQAVRKHWGLGHQFVIGYIGNHESFAGIDFLLESFLAVRRRIPTATLLIVGPADYWLQKLDGAIPAGVIFTGAIRPSEIAAYFHAIDLGVLAQPKSLLTESAFQMKVVEYSACRKFVISTPLALWQRLKWPNVFLVEPEVTAWASAIAQLKDARWSPEWDKIVEAYDWRNLAQQVAQAMLRSS